jgi:cell division protein FtsZ
MDSGLFDPANITEQAPTKTLSTNEAKIAVIGVGGGGCNMINHMIKEGTHKIDLIVANTDLQVLRESYAPQAIQLGPNLTRGLGAGMKPEIGREAALESIEEIKEVLDQKDIVFIAAGLGGGTGTGAASIIAEVAKKAGALTVSVVTTPFKWEGRKRASLAQRGLDELKKVSDSIIVIPNNKLINIIDETTSMQNAFKIVDNVLYQAVHGMSEVILKSGASGINVDFSDVKTIMQYKGRSIMGIGAAKGKDSLKRALENAIKSPLLGDLSLTGAQGLMVHWTISPKIRMGDINNIMEYIHDTVDSDAYVIVGTTADDTLAEDEVKITIVATGFQEQFNQDEETANKPTTSTTQTKYDPNDKDYYDVPPSMRNYSIQINLDNVAS